MLIMQDHHTYLHPSWLLFVCIHFIYSENDLHKDDSYDPIDPFYKNNFVYSENDLQEDDSYDLIDPFHKNTDKNTKSHPANTSAVPVPVSSDKTIIKLFENINMSTIKEDVGIYVKKVKASILKVGSVKAFVDRCILCKKTFIALKTNLTTLRSSLENLHSSNLQTHDRNKSAITTFYKGISSNKKFNLKRIESMYYDNKNNKDWLSSENNKELLFDIIMLGHLNGLYTKYKECLKKSVRLENKRLDKENKLQKRLNLNVIEREDTLFWDSARPSFKNKFSQVKREHKERKSN